MENQALQHSLAESLENKTPFALYLLPQDEEVKLIRQKDTVDYPLSFEEKGFVFAPFSDEDKTFFIPLSAANFDLFEKSIFSNIYPKENKDAVTPNAACKEEYLQLLNHTIETIKTSQIQKIVISRCIEVENIEVNASILLNKFQHLLQLYADAFCYVFYHPEIGIWMGATPEKLLFSERNKLQTVALAGTQVYHGTANVTWGAKEDEEQQMVVDSIQNSLEKYADSVEVSRKYTKRAGNLLHLNSDISATFQISELGLIVNELHPTPAVCGLPKEKAKEFILANETYKRKYYTGYLGEINMPKKIKRKQKSRNQEHKAIHQLIPATHLFVNLRCMQFSDDSAYIYVGGGITESSIAESEWDETVHKSQTMLKVL